MIQQREGFTASCYTLDQSQFSALGGLEILYYCAETCKVTGNTSQMLHTLGRAETWLSTAWLGLWSPKEGKLVKLRQQYTDTLTMHSPEKLSSTCAQVKVRAAGIGALHLHCWTLQIKLYFQQQGAKCRSCANFRPPPPSFFNITVRNTSCMFDQ